MDLVSTYESSHDSADEEGEGTKETAPAAPVAKRRAVEKAVEDEGEASRPVRLFPHVAGNWASHVYVVLDVSDELSDMVQEMFEAISGDARNKSLWVQKERELHVSLSRTVALKLHHIDEFVELLRKAMKALASFELEFPDLRIFSNDNASRAFLALQCGRALPQMRLLIETVDSIMEAFQMDKYYENPQFHTSFVSWVIPPESRTALASREYTEEQLLPEGVSMAKLKRIHRVRMNLGKRVE